MSSVYTLLQGSEPGLDGWDYHRVDAGGVLKDSTAEIALKTISGTSSTDGLILPAGAVVTQALIATEDEITHGAATGVLKLAAALDANATAATVAAVATAAAVSSSLAAQVASSAIALGAPVALGSQTTMRLFAATAAAGSATASTVTSASGKAIPVVVSVFYATPRASLGPASVGFYDVKALAEQVTSVIEST